MKELVQELQRRLVSLGHPLKTFGVDGDYGKETHDAAMAALDNLANGETVKETPSKVEEVKSTSMKTSKAGRAKIKVREGEILTAYQDVVGIWTIGVGHTAAAGSPAPKKGMVITTEESDEILARDLADVEKDILSAVKVSLSQNEFDALVSFVFNIGGTAFKKSTLLKKLNADDRDGAADQFLVWNKAGGNVVKGLTTRREDERKQFLSK